MLDSFATEPARSINPTRVWPKKGESTSYAPRNDAINTRYKREAGNEHTLPFSLCFRKKDLCGN